MWLAVVFFLLAPQNSTSWLGLKYQVMWPASFNSADVYCIEIIRAFTSVCQLNSTTFWLAVECCKMWRPVPAGYTVIDVTVSDWTLTQCGSFFLLAQPPPKYIVTRRRRSKRRRRKTICAHHVTQLPSTSETSFDWVHLCPSADGKYTVTTVHCTLVQLQFNFFRVDPKSGLF